MTTPKGDGLLDLFGDQEQRRPDGPRAAENALSAPQPPLAKRLNRNALTVAAVLMGMTVIASMLVFNNSSREVRTSKRQADPTITAQSQPSFLRRPVELPPQPATASDNGKTAFSPPSSLSRVPEIPRRVGIDGASTNGSSSLNAEHRDISYAAQHDIASVVRTSNGATPEDLRAKAFNAALGRSAIVAGAHGSSESASSGFQSASPGGSGTLAEEESRLVSYGDSVMRSAVRTAPAPATTTGAGAPAPLSSRRAFLRESGDLGGHSVVARIEPAGSPYALRAGTVIPAILLTAISSDLPGDCMGQVSRDVRDSQSQRILLVPKGSKLLCRYDDQVAAGQGRLLVAWTRLLLPDGRSMTLPGLALKDAEGQTGARGDVDNHTARVFGRALLLSAIGAGVQLSQPRQASILAAPGAGQVAAGAVGQELSSVALEILRRGMDQPPTITVPQGRTFNVFLNGDLIFDGPYVPTP